MSVNGENVERVTRKAFVRLFARATEAPSQGTSQGISLGVSQGADKDQVVLEVIHEAAVKLLCNDKRGHSKRGLTMEWSESGWGRVDG